MTTTELPTSHCCRCTEQRAEKCTHLVGRLLCRDHMVGAQQIVEPEQVTVESELGAVNGVELTDDEQLALALTGELAGVLHRIRRPRRSRGHGRPRARSR